MVSSRAVGAGVLSFPVVTVRAVLAEPLPVLVVAFLPTLMTALLSRPRRSFRPRPRSQRREPCTLLFWALFLEG